VTHRLTRRALFTRAAPLAALATLARSTPLARAAQLTSPLKVVWWGEQEAPGIQRWMDDTLARFTSETGVAIQSRLEDSEEVAEGFASAAAAGSDLADVQFFWNGIFLMDSVWRGFLLPLNGLISHSVLKRSGPTSHSMFEGKQYRVGFYTHGFGMAYNKRLLDRAGLNADAPPTTWDGLLNACDRLRAAGIVPIMGGVSDGFWGDWFLTNALPQQLDSVDEALQLFIGNLDWREPRYHDHWARLEELSKHGFLNDDITQLGMYDGLRLFNSGRAGFTLSITASLPNHLAQLGSESVGLTVMPVFGQGKMAGRPIIDKQGFGIPSRAANPGTAARFLEFMHSKERVQAMWTLAHQIPADEAFDKSIVDDPVMRGVVERYWGSNPVLTIEDLMPLRFWTDAMFVASQKIVAGEMTGQQAGELAHQVTEAWRGSVSPETVNNYAIWGNGGLD
jgi:ABC-type glycerol-3-phosphate transport system substrate-binding protein